MESQGTFFDYLQNHHKGLGGLCPSVHLPVNPPAGEKLAQAPDLRGAGFWHPAADQQVGGAHLPIIYVLKGRWTASEMPTS